jgi:hypothetical protein
VTGPEGVEPPGGKVAAGFFSFTEITDPSAHREYNAWHQLDHMPEQMPLAGIAHGQRWVATPGCKKLSHSRSESLSRSHYLTIYLMVPPLEGAVREFYDLARELHSKDRFFEPRRAVISGPLPVLSTRAAERVLISGAAVPYRPNRGVYVIVGAPPGMDSDALLRVPGVAGVWVYGSSETGPSSVGAPRSAGDRFAGEVTVCYLDDDPSAVARLIDGSFEWLDDAEYAGPFETINTWEWDWFESPEVAG